ncbi:hypothetical protein BGZ76_007634, partial [Entomortierella beljakovae]
MEAYRSQPIADCPTTNSETFITGSWACRGLESLTLSFCYDRSSLSKQEQGSISPASARRYLLEQLSRLTSLKNLSVRTTYYDSSSDGDEDEDEPVQETNGSDLMMQRIQQDMIQLAMHDLDSTNAVNDTKKEEGEEEEENDDKLFNIVFTLPSGLSVLGSLKQLQSLILYGVDHAVGVNEIQWMCHHWPKLNRIEGLYWDEDWDEDKL